MSSNKQKVFTMSQSISLWRPAIKASQLISFLDKTVDFKKRTEHSNRKNKNRWKSTRRNLNCSTWNNKNTKENKSKDLKIREKN